MTVVLRIAQRCQRAGIRVIRAAGCETRGNGQSWGQIGGIVNHHTGGGNNIHLDRNLITGRPDLRGPLTNFATLYDGDLAVVAAHPANHAGASGGWDTKPLPITLVFNRLVIGNEIQYRGTEPMSPAQWRTILVFNRIALEEIGHPRQWIRVKFHQGTSTDRKWDPGYAPEKTYDIHEFRRALATSAEPRTDLGDDPVSVIQLPRTPPPDNWDSPKSTWPQTEEVIHLGWVRGWRGRHVIRLAVGHPGGYLFRAHADYPNGPGKGVAILSWVDPAAGQSHDLLPAWTGDREYLFEPDRPGPAALMITYAAPGGLSLSIERER